MKKLHFLALLFCLNLLSIHSFGGVLEFPFNSQNKSFFYLNKTTLDNQGISIAPESSKISEQSKNYTLINFEENLSNFNQITLVQDSKVEKKSGLFFNKSSFVNISFDPSLENGLMIEFWAKPLSTLKGNIFSTQFLTEEGIEKEISVVLEKGRLKINFQNMFVTNTNIGTTKTISLISNSKILPDVWAYHRIVYTPNNGKLTYFHNNEVDNETWATTSGLPKSSVLFLDVPQHPKMTLGGNYRGLLDQFIISNDPTKNFSSRIIGYDKGYIHTRVISLPERAIINWIHLESILPTDTDYVIEYRMAELPFDDNTPTEIIPWREYNSLHPNKNPIIEGKYLQTRIHLISDPDSNYSPLVKKLVVHYSSFEIPLKPIDIKSYSSNGNLILSLHQSVNKSISAYKVYIGTKPESFFGDPANGIQSPILIPVSNLDLNTDTKRLSYQISGLTPHKLYYVKVTAVTVDGIESDFSDTVKTRIRTLE